MSDRSLLHVTVGYTAFTLLYCMCITTTLFRDVSCDNIYIYVWKKLIFCPQDESSSTSRKDCVYRSWSHNLHVAKIVFALVLWQWITVCFDSTLAASIDLIPRDNSNLNWAFGPFRGICCPPTNGHLQVASMWNSLNSSQWYVEFSSGTWNKWSN